MPEGNGSGGDSRSGEGDSSPALWRMVKALFRGSDHDQSLRAQIEEAIEEHEGELGTSPDTSGDLVPLERQMLRNLLHFSEHDADDVAIPRGQIVAVPAGASFAELAGAFAEHGHSRLPIYGESLDEVIGMVQKSGGIDYAAGKMMEYRKDALAILHTYPDSPARQAMEELVNYVIDRKY